MKSILHHIILMILIFCAGQSDAAAQSGIFVPEGGKVFFINDSSAAFSDVTVNGTLGLGNGAVLNFFGTSWQNNPSGILSDAADGGLTYTAQGGTVRFAGSSKQYLDGGYNAVTRTGPAFSRLLVDNENGLFLKDGTLKIGRELALKNGHLFLSMQSLVLGHNSPGSISGYNENRFIVTANAPSSGLMIRERVARNDGVVTFPIGAAPGKYTPAALRIENRESDEIRMTVFSTVREHGTWGTQMADESINTTWELGKRRESELLLAELWLQHRNVDEGTVYQANRNKTYISKFRSAKWETINTYSAPAAGNLTTTGEMINSSMNKRLLAVHGGPLTPITKFATPYVVHDTTWVQFTGYRRTRELVELSWATKPERAVDYFIVTRRLSDETTFTAVDTVKSKVRGGYSDKYTFYDVADRNTDGRISYYQLIWVDLDGTRHYSLVIAVSNKAGGYELLLWPNPSKGEFKVGVNGYAAVKTIAVWDVAGQKILEEAVAGRSIVPLRIGRPGVYFVGYLSYSNQLLETKKLVVLPHE